MSEPDQHLTGVLMRTFDRAADAAPPPPADLYRTVTTRYARRRARRIAAVTVLVLLAGVLGLVRFSADEPAPVARIPDVFSADAVRTLPPTIEGRRYVVDAVLGDGRVVVQTPVREGGRSEIRLLDAAGRGTPRLVVSYQSTFARPVYIETVRATDDWLTWVVNRPRGDGTEIWTLRWEENRPRRVAQVRDELTEFSVTLVGDRVIYGPTKEGIRSVPAAGGASTLLPGTAGHYTVLWPWLVTNPGADPPNYTRNRPTLRNVETGETITAQFTPTGWRDACGPAWCVGQGWNGQHLTAFRVDGTDPAVLTGYRTDFVALTPVRDRYLPLIRIEPAPDGSQQLVVGDLEHWRTIDVGRVANDPSALVLTTFNDGVFAWSSADGSGMKVLDLRRFG